MKNQNILHLISNNKTLKKYYIPLTSIKVNLYPVMANNFEEAIYLANLGPTSAKGSVKKTFILDEYFTNEAYESLDIPLNKLFSRLSSFDELSFPNTPGNNLITESTNTNEAVSPPDNIKSPMLYS